MTAARSAPPLLLLALLGAGCGGDPAADAPPAADPAAAEAEDPSGRPALVLVDPNKRSYSNPDTTFTPAETADFNALCGAVVQCRQERLGPDAQASVFRALKTSSEWGKMVRDYLEGHTLDQGGVHLARVVRDENLEGRAPACARVVALYR
jgi:hypothetical protein